ncbi:MAG: hypothetical protein ACTSQJ_01045 [Promethearchaeota archaeon]
MSKKIFYYISIFYILLICPALPIVVAGTEYELGIPDAAVGQQFTSTVKLYDEDVWKDYVGDGDPTDVWNGDSDTEGAKAKTELLEIDEDANYDMLDDSSVKESVDDYISFSENMDDLGASLVGVGTVLAGAGYATVGGQTQVWGNTLVGLGMTESEVEDSWDNDYDAVILTTNSWDYTSDAFEADPDDEEKEDPVIKDPADAKNIYDDIEEFATKAGLDMGTAAGLFVVMLAGGNQIASWNATHRAVIDATLGAGTAAALDAACVDALNQLSSTEATELSEKYFVVQKLNDGFVLMKPLDDYVKEIIDEFDFDEDELEWDNSKQTITVHIEKDDVTEFGEAEDDFDIVYKYSDTGTQKSVTFLDKDGNEFYKKEADPTILDYIIPIAIGIVVLIAIIAIVIIIKKKKS